MKSKKYADQKSALQKPPMACVTTLSQAKALLLSSHVWDRVKCVDDPPFFQCTLNLSPPSPGPDSSGRREMPNSDSPQLVIGIDYVLCGIGMIEYRSIHDIFAGILSEYLNQETTTDEERQRTSKIILEETESQRDERRIKNNLLIISAVVNGHSLHRFGREDIAVKMVDSLISSIRQAVEPASGIVVTVLQEVKLALRTLSEDTQLDPKVRQKCRNEYLNLHTRMEKYI